MKSSPVVNPSLHRRIDHNSTTQCIHITGQLPFWVAQPKRVSPPSQVASRRILQNSMQSGMDESDSTVPTVNLLDLNDHWKEALTRPAGWRPEPFVCGRKLWLQASYYMNILRHRFFLEVIEKFYPEGVRLPVTTLPAPTKMTRQWVSSILVSWGYQVYHLNGMRPASEVMLEKLLQDHPNVSGSYDWEGWLKTANPIMKGLYGNMPDPIKHPLDWQCVLLESDLSGNPPAPMVESNPASWQLCLETVIKELDKHQPGSSPEVPMEVDPLTVQPSSFKRPHPSPPKTKDVNFPRFHLGVIHLRGQPLLAMQPGQPIASGSSSGNVSEPNVPPAPSSNSEGLSFSEYNSWGVWLTPVAALTESELREPIEEEVEMQEPIEEGVEMREQIEEGVELREQIEEGVERGEPTERWFELWEIFRKQSYSQQHDQQLLGQICDLQLQPSFVYLGRYILTTWSLILNTSHMLRQAAFILWFIT
ncbi:uncharacterized protein EDB91DRAFT_1088028 [Suillus paluster]|uniref:uncharacterized protein n=1 Tax=Suillus paluster TaxID=48578 RepID=UPI001B8744A8|nr:uncharacterized protein EDB91DRAFT_1088028 [Suillus paluster]KAG1722734.1 hypothetical protein EDB91DRAFT_1088028 [Suillus paluster]